MASLRNRADYLDDYTPGEASSLFGGKRFIDFTSLPGTLGDLSGPSRNTFAGRMFDSLSTFRSKSQDPASNFERFLSLYQNPDALVEKKMKVPVGFNQAYALSGLQ
jgi:hypothetical protein